MKMTSMDTGVSIASTGAGSAKQVTFASATAAVIGESIAVGIFLTPAGMAKALGSPFWLLLVWITVGMLTVSGALCYGELAARFPQDGGIYVYLFNTCGRGIAFLYGWMCLLVLDPGLTAALAVGLASYAAYLLPSSLIGIKFGAISVIWALCILNMLSVPLSAGFLRWSTWLKLALLGFLVAWAVAFHQGSWSNLAPFIAQRPGSLPLGQALGAAMVGAFFSFGGWWDVSKLAGEIQNPGRTLPRAMLMGVLVVTAIYILVSAVFMYQVPLTNVTSDETFVAQAGTLMFGHTGGAVFAAIVVVCVFSSLAAFMISAPRVYYAMAKDGLFLRGVAQIHPRFHTPANAILIQALIASVLVALGSFQQIIAYFIFIAVVFLALTGFGLFIARSSGKGANATFSTPAYPLPLLIFLTLMAVLLVLLALHNPKAAMLGTAVVLAGVPVYAIFQYRNGRVLSRQS
ncbi:MAG TPA: amino acid permease [Terriglobales bacterium]|jgi:APA family basic amino acid/polyamine antiporter|nr:amino acid permease [Terriglobales bacterium]